MTANMDQGAYLAQKNKKNLYVSISNHGFGHIGQMAPILNKLAFEYGDRINFTIQCNANDRFLDSVLTFPFKHIQKADDLGMIMTNSLDVQSQQTHRAYRDFHKIWPKAAMLKCREIERQRSDAVVSNISYMTLAAAKHLKLPHLGLCSLNWADIYQSYCQTLPGSLEIHQKALQHYQEADHILVPTPGMPMTDLNNRRVIGPLSRLGNRYPHFKKRLNLPAETQLVMVSMGGIPHHLNSQHWPKMENVVWLDTGEGQSGRSDILPLKDMPFSFIDVLANCDLLICKPGYGLFAEATCNGIPILYVKRGDWPEEPYLVNWLNRHNQCAELDRDAFQKGEFAEEVAKMLMVASYDATPTPITPTGVGEACGYILELLGLA